MLCFDKSKESAIFSIILRQFLVIFRHLPLYFSQKRCSDGHFEVLNRSEPQFLNSVLPSLCNFHRIDFQACCPHAELPELLEIEIRGLSVVGCPFNIKKLKKSGAIFRSTFKALDRSTFHLFLKCSFRIIFEPIVSCITVSCLE